jgi:hypothetical protein
MFPSPITIESRRRKLQKFLKLPQLRLEVLSYPLIFRGRQAPPEDESRVVGLKRGEKSTSLLTTDFFAKK